MELATVRPAAGAEPKDDPEGRGRPEKETTGRAVTRPGWNRIATKAHLPKNQIESNGFVLFSYRFPSFWRMQHVPCMPQSFLLSSEKEEKVLLFLLCRSFGEQKVVSSKYPETVRHKQSFLPELGSYLETL
jgi:hypothetical protein